MIVARSNEEGLMVNAFSEIYERERSDIIMTDENKIRTL
ncbi:hypothetical protein ACPOL_1308 [Acidisarcina polymorpha]|uniref:Uncharacterized protein n=1 Tax=Acidisarcina polymorpha TaxID=2211140 RepID=A0A2Z5FW62_9BACT|nr:hypothetical protein ACPOL_1308 [Acidisarcina polymorpha]